jgi:hypothetical protein
LLTGEYFTRTSCSQILNFLLLQVDAKSISSLPWVDAHELSLRQMNSDYEFYLVTN